MTYRFDYFSCGAGTVLYSHWLTRVSVFSITLYYAILCSTWTWNGHWFSQSMPKLFENYFFRRRKSREIFNINRYKVCKIEKFHNHLTLWVPGGLFRPRVIKMLAISKPMIQLPWFFLTFPQLMNTTGLPKKNYMHLSNNFMLFDIILWSYQVRSEWSGFARASHSLSVLKNRLFWEAIAWKLWRLNGWLLNQTWIIWKVV